MVKKKLVGDFFFLDVYLDILDFEYDIFLLKNDRNFIVKVVKVVVKGVILFFKDFVFIKWFLREFLLLVYGEIDDLWF